MRLSYLREFVALTDYAKLTAAARALHVSPSTLSQHVAALEREIGCELFSRDGGFTLTEDGFRALGHARSILCEYDELLRDCAESEEDVVYLSFPIWDMCQPPLARAKDAFRELHPDVKVVLSSNEHDLDDPVEMLVNGSSDVSLLYLIRESGQRIADMVPSDISWVPVGAYRVVFACAPQHPNADKGVLTAGDLDQATVITGLHPLASIFAEGIVAVLGGHGVTVRVVFKRLLREYEALHDDLGDEYVVWFEPLGDSPGYFDLPGSAILRFEHDVTAEAYLLYRPASLGPLQREYLSIVRSLHLKD